jgi:hypothetical protein
LLRHRSTRSQHLAGVALEFAKKEFHRFVPNLKQYKDEIVER